MPFDVDFLAGVDALKTELSLGANLVTYPIVRVGHAPVPTKICPILKCILLKLSGNCGVR